MTTTSGPWYVEGCNCPGCCGQRLQEVDAVMRAVQSARFEARLASPTPIPWRRYLDFLERALVDRGIT